MIVAMSMPDILPEGSGGRRAYALPLLRFIGQRRAPVNLGNPLAAHVRKKAVVKRAAKRWSTPRRPVSTKFLSASHTMT